MGMWSHQSDNIRAHGIDAAHALFWEPRIGKTRAVIGHMERLKSERTVRRTLIIGPALPLRTTWMSELRLLRGYDITDCTEGALIARAKRIEFATLMAAANPDVHHVMLVNYDVLHKLRKYIVQFRSQLIIADEAHLCKNAGTKRASALKFLGDYAEYRRVLTGTPDPLSYQDYYAIYRFLDKSIFGTRLADFQERYLKLHPIYRSVIGYKTEHLPELRSKVVSISSRKTRNECFDMPKMHIIERQVDLPTRAWTIYNKVKKEHVYKDDWLTIDAEHQIARLGVLQRITGGFAYQKSFHYDDIVRETEWVHTAKIDALITDLNELVEFGHYAVVFYLYQGEGDGIERSLQRTFGLNMVARLDGNTPAQERLEMTAPFDPARCESVPKNHARILVVQEQVGALGVSFANAHHAFFYSYSMNYAAHSQAADRIWSAGSDTHLTLTYFTVPKSVDVTIRKIVSDKEFSSRMLLDYNFRQLAEGQVK